MSKRVIIQCLSRCPKVRLQDKISYSVSLWVMRQRELKNCKMRLSKMKCSRYFGKLMVTKATLRMISSQKTSTSLSGPQTLDSVAPIPISLQVPLKMETISTTFLLQ